MNPALTIPLKCLMTDHLKFFIAMKLQFSNKKIITPVIKRKPLSPQFDTI